MKFNHKSGVSFRIFLVLVLFLIAGVIMVSNSTDTYADDEKEPEKISQQTQELDIITIDNKGYKKDRKGPSEFNHIKHARDYKVTCYECHHVYKETEKDEDGKKINMWSPWEKEQKQKCSECHDPLVEKDGAMILQAAYHKNCKVCHIEKKIYKYDVLAYRKCTTCHK